MSAREHRGIMQSLRQLQSSRCSNQPMAVDFGFVARSFHLMASFVERQASSFLLTLKLNCKFYAACRTITFGSMVAGTLTTDQQNFVTVLKCCMSLLSHLTRMSLSKKNACDDFAAYAPVSCGRHAWTRFSQDSSNASLEV